MHTGLTGTAETSRLSPRNGFTAYTYSPRGSGLSCPRCQRQTCRQGSARVAAPGPYDFAVRGWRFRPRDLHRTDAGCVHRIPCPTFRDDREASLRRAQGAGNLLPIYGIVNRNFCLWERPLSRFDIAYEIPISARSNSDRSGRALRNIHDMPVRSDRNDDGIDLRPAALV